MLYKFIFPEKEALLNYTLNKMGIPGLTKFITDRSDSCLRPLDLKDSYIVIDGTNLSSQIYKWHLNTISAFGGDYDAFFYVLRDFFFNLKKCNVTPIVIMDGGHEKKKLNTLNKRQAQRMRDLMNFNKGCYKGPFFPLLMQIVFNDALEELGVINVTCFFEADGEIAAVARYLNCPVLSYDSDFFIYDVLYVPFDKFCIEPSKISVDGTSKYCMKCYIYDVLEFLEKFKGLDQSLLPLVAALLGNDYVDSDIFNKFFNHVIMLPSSRNTYTQQKILGLMHWLKKETLSSAKQLILNHICQRHVKKAIKIIDCTIDEYKKSSPTVLPLLKLKEFDQEESSCININELKENEKFLTKLPKRFIDLFRNGKFDLLMIDMMNLNRYYMRIQVEDARKSNSHSISFPIISAIYKILCSFIDKKEDLLLYMKDGKKYISKQLCFCVDSYFKGLDVKNILESPISVKRKLIYDILGINDDWQVHEEIDNDWILFIISLVFWAKNSPECLPIIYLQSLIIMALANYVQSHVGHFKNYSSFMRNRAGAIGRLSKEVLVVPDLLGNSFSELLDAIKEIEFLKFTEKFIKLRQAEDEVVRYGYFINIIHEFASLQSCIFHMINFNSLLDFPFPHLKVHKFYSGTLLYNILYIFQRQSNLTHFIDTQLKDMPNIANIYKYLMKKLSHYFAHESCDKNKQNKVNFNKPLRYRKRKNRTRRR